MELYNIKCFAESIARESGDNILLPGFYSVDKGIVYKSRTDLLTRLDKESESFIVNKINETFPGHGVVAEEGSGFDNSKNLVWLIDPLDATNNFAHGIPHFCISLALFSKENRESLVAVIYDPFKKEMYTSIKGHGAYLNGIKINVSEINEIGLSILGTGFPYRKDIVELNNLKQFNAVLPLSQGVRRMGSAALDLCYVASGRLDGFWEPLLRPWDMAAGALIVIEAGGKVTGYRNNLFDPYEKEIISSNGLIHDKLVEIITNSTDLYPAESKLF